MINIFLPTHLKRQIDVLCDKMGMDVAPKEIYRLISKGMCVLLFDDFDGCSLVQLKMILNLKTIC